MEFIDGFETIFDIPQTNSASRCLKSIENADNKYYSLIYNEATKSFEKRDDDLLLRPICIDAMDISDRYNQMLANNRDTFPMDRSILNVRAVTIALWYFITRGHTAVAFFGSTLHQLATKCTDPYELQLLANLDLIILEDTGDVTSSDISKTIVDCAMNSDGCVVGRRKKYLRFSRKHPDLADIVINRFLRPSFVTPNSMKFRCEMNLSMNINSNQKKVARKTPTGNPLSFQLSASDQLYIMGKLARIIGDESLMDLYMKAREMNMRAAKNNDRNQKFHSSLSQQCYQYSANDPFLPEYVVPAASKPRNSRKITRIGNKNSIYRVGGPKNAESEHDIIDTLRAPYVEALTPIFGAEKALKLVSDNPQCNDINEFVELGFS
ncbi:unnamed protein product [Caenorhabditis bovis]|uniref:RNase NYN domain-containing protein n=1 Tax=Caenorhabditis bovis TaxID=2654633 RepID=A0A8S1EYZ1_9PELO|nr:unnamed protein product [Caenorhabditis bovis]